MNERVGLIAGLGRFPFDVAGALRKRGRSVVAVGFHRITDFGLEKEVDSWNPIHLGELEKLLAVFREHGIEDVVMAGKIPKTALYEDPQAFHPDARAIAMISRLADRKDDSILGAVAEVLDEEKIRLRGQAEFTPELLVGEGPLGAVEATKAQLAELRFAWPIAKTLGHLDVGQTVVVKERAVLALEAIEGTDAAIRRAGEVGGRGACVLKVAKPRQDPRFDIPAIGPGTLDSIEKAGVAVVGVEAGATVVFERETVIARADALGVAVVGVSAGSLGVET